MEALNELRRLRSLAEDRGNVLSQVRCSVAELLIAALDCDAVDSQTFDEVCNRFSANHSLRAGYDPEEVVWTVLNVARRLRAEATNTIDPIHWNTVIIRHRMVLALYEIATSTTMYLSANVILRVPEAVEQTLQWFGGVWSADASLAERPLWQVVRPVVLAASFYSELDNDGE